MMSRMCFKVITLKFNMDILFLVQDYYHSYLQMRSSKASLLYSFMAALARLVNWYIIRNTKFGYILAEPSDIFRYNSSMTPIKKICCSKSQISKFSTVTATELLVKIRMDARTSKEKHNCFKSFFFLLLLIFAKIKIHIYFYMSKFYHLYIHYIFN